LNNGYSSGSAFLEQLWTRVKEYANTAWKWLKYLLCRLGATVLLYLGSHKAEKKQSDNWQGRKTGGSGVPSRKDSATDSRYDDPGYKPRRRTPTWWRVVKGGLTLAMRGVASLLLVLVITGCIVGATSMIYILMFLDKDIDFDLNQLKLSLTSTIYVENNSGQYEEYQKLHGTENREWLNLTEMRSEDYTGEYSWIADAMVAIEDHRFFEHSGVDWKRTIYCFAVYFLHSDGDAQGGSTITQQLIKNLTGENEVSIDRKLKEIFRALELEKEYTKQMILEAYLNVIALGNGCNGVDAAAQTYFGKEVDELSLAECAAIVGITKNPTKYNPLRRPENNKERQLLVLHEMLEYGFINQEQYDQAVAEELVFNENSVYNAENTTYNNWYVDQMIYDLRRELVELAGYSEVEARQAVYNGGLQIYSCMDVDLQNGAERIFKDPSNFAKFPGQVQPQCAIVVMDYEGAVRCIVGGRGEKDGDLDFSMASQARRQPGSSIKPLASYGPAVAAGLLEYSTPVTDEKITIKQDGRNVAWPKNSGGHYRGNTPAVKGIEVSSNCMAVRIARVLTPTTVFNWLTERFHLELVESGPQNDVNLSTSLGGLTNGVTVLEMTAAYGVFGSGGVYHAPYTYSKVLDSSGDVIISHGPEDGERVMSSDAATIMNYMLRAPITGSSGTARSYKISGFTTIGKTGTTSNDYDRYFAGGTPYYISCCWFGYEVQKELSIKSPNHAAAAWKKVMNLAHDGLESKGFENMSGNVVKRTYCTVSGGFAGAGCSSTATGYYVRGSSMPVCPVHSGGTATAAFTRFLENPNWAEAATSDLTSDTSATETTTTSATETTTTPGVVITTEPPTTTTTTTTTTTDGVEITTTTATTTTTTTGIVITVPDGNNPLDPNN